MLIEYDEYRTPSFKLTRAETQELEDTGFVVTEDGYCVTLDTDGNYKVCKEIEGYYELKLNYGGRK